MHHQMEKIACNIFFHSVIVVVTVLDNFSCSVRHYHVLSWLLVVMQTKKIEPKSRQRQGKMENSLFIMIRCKEVPRRFWSGGSL